MPKSNEPAEKGLAARKAALSVLFDVQRRGRALDDALAQADSAALETRDRGFLRHLVTTALRRRGQIQAILAEFLSKPLPNSSGPTAEILALAATELLFLDVPPHAAVSSAVALAGQDRNARAFRGLVNAVSRRMAERGKDLVSGQDAARLNTPDWLWSSWTAAYGSETCRAIATAHLGEAPLDISVKGDPEAWEKPLDATRLPTGTLRRWSGGRVDLLPGYQEGAWWIQDAAAALVPRLLPDVAGKRVLDLCAAPGGKTMWLASRGAEVTALDRSAPRLARLADNLRRTGLSADIVEADGAAWRAPEAFPLILLDAPCSATGTIRRHPDIAWSKTERDVATLAALQQRLLDAAIANLSPGGVLVFATCSLESAEGPDQIRHLLARGAPVRRDPIGAQERAGLEDLVTPDGDLRALPSHLASLGGLDGFFASRLIRL